MAWRSRWAKRRHVSGAGARRATVRAPRLRRRDTLSGRFIAVAYDLDDMLRRVSEIEQADLYALRPRILPT